MRLDCVGCEPELAAWAAGELDAPTRDAVAGHLGTCPYCRQELDRELALRGALAGLPEARCPDEVSERVLGAVARERHVAGRRRRRRIYGAGAALAAAALAGILLLRPGSPPDLPGSGTGPEAATPVASGAAEPGGAAAATPADPSPYTAAQVAAARRDLIRTVTLAARLLDQAGRSTLADVFSAQLPAAVAGSLRPLDQTPRGG